MSTRIIIMDLDGVILDARDLHYESLNYALSLIDVKYIISREDHLKSFDGLPTKTKLRMLTEAKGLPISSYGDISKVKQEKTIELIKSTFGEDAHLISLFKKLKEEGLKMYVASNSLRETIKIALLRKGLMEYVDYFFSQEDVLAPKPSPEIYLKAILHSGFKPKECLIVEDSQHGRQAAIDSGAHLCAVENPSDVTYEKIKKSMDSIENKNSTTKWKGDDFNVVIPCAGLGSRFASKGYVFPKPLIEVHQKPMIQVVTENLGIDAKFIYIVQKEHYEKYNMKYLLNLISPGCEIIQVDGLTEGAACTVLKAKELINNDKHLLIANSDQFLEWNPNEFYYSMTADNVDGGIMTFQSTNIKWSFVKLGEDGYATEIAEKIPISSLASTGVYYWNKGSDFIKYAEQMIEKNIRVNNEFYVAPVYNEAIADGKKIKTFDIEVMHGLGTPTDLEYFLQNYKGKI